MKGLIKLFDSNETNFKHNKNVLSEFTSAYITEDIDGTLEFDGEYPLFDEKKLSKELNIGKTIKSPIYDNRHDQLFKIRKPNFSTSNKSVSVYAQAIGYADLGSNIVLGCHIPAGTTRKKAIEMLLNARQQKIRDYHVGNLDTSTNTNINLGLDESTGEVINYLDIDYKSPLKGLLDESENSIYKAYRGELIWDNFEINMVNKRGSDNKFTIRSGKNLQDLEKEISDMDDDFATALIMCSSDGLYLPNNEIIYSSLANKYDRYHYKVIKCDDVSLEDLITENSTDEDVEKAKQVVYEQLRERAQNYFNEGMAELLGSYTINFLELAKSEEYKDYSQLTNCSIGNEVTTIYPELDLKVTTRVTKIKYNVLKDEIEEITVGNIKKDIADSINNTENKVDNVADKVNNNKNDLKKTKVTMEKYNNSIVLKVENLSKDTMAKIEVLEKEIVAKVSEDDMWSLIEMNPSKILFAVNDEKNETDVTITTDGLGIYKGKIQIYDENDNLVFKIREKGGINSRLPYKIMESDMDTTAASFTDRGISWHSTSTSIRTSSKGVYIDTNNKNLYVDGEKLEDVIRAVLKNEGLI
ncbi:phage tail protein [Clostridium botulinum]|nr:phage tail spike protein [Clostridium botulinum]EES51341.1 phage minor structural protein [Clostridium botulinum E1 str. 'BoNT E Beluga']MBY6762828.1 phage tail protein [Clostridium botulinum]MBY6921612.1 phage tail protein [Clostridium botulinum]MCR1132814.1 phage tail protein [Clostridium botulinum]HBZ6637873.1 phage tail protein [Clostridium botulinum]